MSLWYWTCMCAGNWAGVRARSTRQASTFSVLCCVYSTWMCIISRRAWSEADAYRISRIVDLLRWPALLHVQHGGIAEGFCGNYVSLRLNHHCKP